MDLDFSEQEIQRYSRQILLKEVGGTGQALLRAASVLIIGAGGLGSPAALYLAAAGVGRIGLIDDDQVELSNLQRQIAHSGARIGMAKPQSAVIAIAAVNDLVRVEPMACRVDGGNVDRLVGDYDIVLDGTDNFATRFLVADACVRAKRTLVSAAVLRFEGQLSTFKPHQGSHCPCYRCLYPEPPPDGLVPSCSQAGVMGPVTGVLGVMQASEAIKEIVGIGTSLAGILLLWDALDMQFRRISIPRNSACAVCGGGVDG